MFLHIKFYWAQHLDVVQQDTGIYVFNSEGIMTMHPLMRLDPSPDAFLGGVKMVGIATKKEKKLVYTFDQLTPELLSSGIYGLGPVSCTMPVFTIIVDDLGRRTAWSRLIERIYYTNY